MKPNFTDKLFEKQIDPEMAGIITGGDCTITEITDGNDTITTVYNDDGMVISKRYEFEEC